ncbi:MAG: hypothetical protein FWG02_00705 [Holophagaceae bacterium]|nr:hypothetical protein [Holophagaceae bacterium]
MNNSDGDTSSVQPREKFPLWGKILMGCGIVMLLSIAGCVSFAYWASHSGKDVVLGWANGLVLSKLEKPWNQFLSVVEAIKTDEGASKLYKDNPELLAIYPTEAEFVKNSAIWRTKVKDLPSSPPTLEELQKDILQLNYHRPTNGKNTYEIRYKMPDRTTIWLRWEGEKLVEIDIR